MSTPASCREAASCQGGAPSSTRRSRCAVHHLLQDVVVAGKRLEHPPCRAWPKTAQVASPLQMFPAVRFHSLTDEFGRRKLRVTHLGQPLAQRGELIPHLCREPVAEDGEVLLGLVCLLRPRRRVDLEDLLEVS